MQPVDTAKGEEGKQNGDLKPKSLQEWLNKNHLTELYPHLTQQFSILSIDELLLLKESPNGLWKVVCDYFYSLDEFKFKFVGMQMRIEKLLNEYKKTHHPNDDNKNNKMVVIDKDEQKALQQLNSIISLLKSESKSCNEQIVKSAQFIQNAKQDLHEMIEKLEQMIIDIFDSGLGKYSTLIQEYSQAIENNISYLTTIQKQCEQSIQSSNLYENDHKQNNVNVNSIDRNAIVSTIQTSLRQTAMGITQANAKINTDEEFDKWGEDTVMPVVFKEIPNMIAKTMYVYATIYAGMNNFGATLKTNYNEIITPIKTEKDKTSKKFRDILMICGNGLNYIDEIKDDLKQNGYEILCETKEAVQLSKDIFDGIIGTSFVVDFAQHFAEIFGTLIKKQIADGFDCNKCVILLVESIHEIDKLWSLMGPMSCQIAKRYEPLSWNAKYFDEDQKFDQYNDVDLDMSKMYFSMFMTCYDNDNKTTDKYAKLVFKDWKKGKNDTDSKQEKHSRNKDGKKVKGKKEKDCLIQ